MAKSRQQKIGWYANHVYSDPENHLKCGLAEKVFNYASLTSKYVYLGSYMIIIIMIEMVRLIPTSIPNIYA